VPDQRHRTGAQAIERAIGVLRCFETATDLGITEIARKLGLSISTAHRVTKALTEGGLLAQDPKTERYQLGPTLVVLGDKAARGLGYEAALPSLRALSTDTGESVNLGIRAGTDVHVVLDVASPQPLRFSQQPGTRVPLHTSAMGKCLLAFAGDIEAEIAGLGELAPVTEKTITDPETLAEELRRVRDRGWALNDEERHAGVRTVAVPVMGSDGRVVAAIAVQGPTVRITEDKISALAERLQSAAEEVGPLLVAAR
jgi:DNA-binding IclR family transcriptional regulator